MLPSITVLGTSALGDDTEDDTIITGLTGQITNPLTGIVFNNAYAKIARETTTELLITITVYFYGVREAMDLGYGYEAVFFETFDLAEISSYLNYKNAQYEALLTLDRYALCSPVYD